MPTFRLPDNFRSTGTLVVCGESAFGTKAGDLFTRITIVAATVWILLCITTILVLNPQNRSAARTDEEGKSYTTLESRGGESEEGSEDAAGGIGPAEEIPAGDSE